MGFYAGIEQPERDVHRLDVLDAVVRGERVRQQPFPFVKFLQRRHRVLLRLLERNHEVGLQHAAETVRQHGRVAAVAALRRHRVLVGDDLRAAGGAGEGPHRGHLVLAPFAARGLGIPFGLLGLLGLCRHFLLFLEKLFDGADLQLRAAVFARHLVVSGLE